MVTRLSASDVCVTSVRPSLEIGNGKLSWCANRQTLACLDTTLLTRRVIVDVICCRLPDMAGSAGCHRFQGWPPGFDVFCRWPARKSRFHRRDARR